MPDLDYTRALHKDHIHPASSFRLEKLSQQIFLENKPDMLAFYKNSDNWNSIVNLHLLEESKNISKQDRPFVDWFKDQEGLTKAGLLIPENAPLEFEAFQEFIELRTKYLTKKLVELGKSLPSDESDIK